MIFKLGLLAICYMNNFSNLPSSIRGKVTLNLKNHVTIAVYNKNKSEVVEMTFAKNKCKVGK